MFKLVKLESGDTIIASWDIVGHLAGWIDGQGYGNRVFLDHGNGYKTLYTHLQAVYVVAGQTVKRGDRIGKMGSTGRSTGTHLHFEIFLNGARLSPLNILK